MLLNNYSFIDFDHTERINNVLPSTYTSWLAFYDDIPAEHKDAEELRFVYSGAEYYTLGTKPKEHIIQREYLLARIAEELLPLRITEGDYHALRMTIAQSFHSGSPQIEGETWKKLKRASIRDKQ